MPHFQGLCNCVCLSHTSAFVTVGLRTPCFSSRAEEMAVLRVFSEALVRNLLPETLWDLELYRCILNEVVAVKGTNPLDISVSLTRSGPLRGGNHSRHLHLQCIAASNGWQVHFSRNICHAFLKRPKCN